MTPTFDFFVHLVFQRVRYWPRAEKFRDGSHFEIQMVGWSFDGAQLLAKHVLEGAQLARASALGR